MDALVRLFAALSYLLAPAALFAQPSDGHDAVREQLEGLLAVQDPSGGFIAVALGVAFLAGAAHALTPGHGKAIVAAYLAGSRGTIGDAVYLGTVVTVTHTASVFVLGLITLYAAQHFRMERVFTGLSLVSGLMIVVIGGWLLQSRWKAMRSGGNGSGHGHSHWPWGGHHHHHEHAHTAHEHGHTHSHEEGHSHEHGHSHSHDEGHSNEHRHSHSHNEGHSHDHGHSHSHSHEHSHEHGHSHGHEGHGHEGHEHHRHPAPKAGRGSLLSLGISGGLVPCPEAMAVLLISFNLNRLAFGLIILVAFSLGLAAVLIAIGIAMVLAGPSLNRFAKDGPVTRMLPVGSAALVTLLGVAILFKTASDSGLLAF
jgi:nickel/cobalt transporter (NicO) family protein